MYVQSLILHLHTIFQNLPYIFFLYFYFPLISFNVSSSCLFKYS
nr:MAG TPA: hypothetical protein [Caudoviricetes sp.]